MRDSSVVPSMRHVTITQEATYLLFSAAHIALRPFLSAYAHQLCANIGSRFLGQAIVRARQLGSEETLLAAVATNGASACFVFGSESIGCGRSGHRERETQKGK